MIQQKQVEFAKELDDAMILAITLLSDIRAGKSAAEITGDALPKLMEAIAGIDQVPAEMASRKVALQTIGYRAGELADALLG